MNKLIVISGCSGGGKSTLLSELSSNGYSIIPEVGREIVKEQLELNSDITPWKNPKLFCEKLIEKSVIAYQYAKKITTTKDQVIFFDRCFLEGVSYYQTLKIEDANKYDNLIHELRYYPIILMTPPWKEIYCQDDERKHAFEEAVIEYERARPFLWDASERNVIVDNGKISGIVDVDEICFGDPLFVLGLTYSALENEGCDTLYCDYWSEALRMDNKAQIR